MKAAKKKPQGSSTSYRCKVAIKPASKKKASKPKSNSILPKGARAACKDAWLEYLAITPSFFLSSEPKTLFLNGWEYGVEWAMQTINGPDYKG